MGHICEYFLGDSILFVIFKLQTGGSMQSFVAVALDACPIKDLN